jgi:hypothetical protein
MYDPMVAKLIVRDVDREHATRMPRALGEYELGGRPPGSLPPGPRLPAVERRRPAAT